LTAAPHATTVMPTTGPGTESWRVGRAAVPAARPEPVSAQPQAASYPPQAGLPTSGGPGYPAGGAGYPPPGRPGQATGYPATPSRRSGMGAWIFGAAAIVVALVMVLGAVGFSSGWFSDDPPAPKKAPAEAAPRFEVQTYTGQGMTLHVPKDWKRVDTKGYVQFHDPKDNSNWLRINVTRDGRTAMKILQASDRNFDKGCCGLTDYQRVALRKASLAGHEGAELEYTASRSNSGQERHGIWRMIVVGGSNYQVYMSVSAASFDGHKQVFDEAVRSTKLAG
ncbi:MAG: hypothetical protein ACRDT4_16045, partial [Micromonosporaceae bacterium]